MFYFEDVDGAYGSQLSDNTITDPNNDFPSQKKDLIAHKNTMVDPATGDVIKPSAKKDDKGIIQKDEQGNPILEYVVDGKAIDVIGEYDYYLSIPSEDIMATNPTNSEEIQSNMILATVIKADSNNKFDK